MSVPGQSLHGRPSGKFGHVGYASESGSKFKALAASLRAVRIDGATADVISSSETGAYKSYAIEFSDDERTAIRPMLPNEPCGVWRVNDRRVLDGISWVLRSGAPWSDLPATDGPRTTS